MGPLPPDRSHISIALSASLWAQSTAGAGVGAAASADSDGASSDAGGSLAGTEAGGADAAWLPAGAWDAVPVPQAVTSSSAVNASAGSLRWFVIASSSKSNSTNAQAGRDSGPPVEAVAPYHSAIECIHTISCTKEPS